VHRSPIREDPYFVAIVRTTEALSATIDLLLAATLEGDRNLAHTLREEARILKEHLLYLKKERSGAPPPRQHSHE